MKYFSGLSRNEWPVGTSVIVEIILSSGGPVSSAASSQTGRRGSVGDVGWQKFAGPDVGQMRYRRAAAWQNRRPAP